MSVTVTQLGTGLRLSVAFKDLDGVPKDPGTVTVAIIQPDGTPDTGVASPAHDGAANSGLYHVDYKGTQPGRYYGQFVGSGGLDAVKPFAFDVGPSVVSPISRGYVSLAEFRANPTYLSLDDIRVGDASTADQDQQLADLIGRASAWADNYCNQPLGGHAVSESRRLRADRYGRVKFTPDHGPVRQISAFAYGAVPTALTSLTSPSAWIDGTASDPQNSVVVTVAGAQAGPWSGSLQFGGPIPDGQLFVTWTAVCGYAHTYLMANVAAAATSAVVADPTGIVAGDVLRICDPGLEEAVTVAPSYVAGATTVPFTAALRYAHTANVTITRLPEEARQAVINMTCALLQRPGAATEDPFADAPTSPTTHSGASPQSGGGTLVTEARRMLAGFRRVR